MKRRVDPEAAYGTAIEDLKRETAEGLGDLRARAVMRRIERELAAPPRLARWLWPSLAVGALAAAAAIVVAVWPTAPAPQAPVALRPSPAAPAAVVWRAGQVEIVREADGVALPRGAVALDAVARAHVSRGARLDLALPHEVRVALHGPAQLRFAPGEPATLVAGRAELLVAPRGKEDPFALAAGDTEVVVHGTRFSLDVRGSRLERAQVLEGTVELWLRSGGAPRRLGAGEAYSAPGAQAALPLPSGSFEAPWWQAGSTTPGHLAIASEPSGAAIRIDEVSLGVTPVTARWPAGTVVVALDLEGHRPFRRMVALDPGQLETVEARLEIEPPPRHEPPALRRPPRVEPPRAEPETDAWKKARAALEAGRCAQLDDLVRRLVADAEAEPPKAQAEMLAAECRLRAGDRRRALAQYQRIAGTYRDTPSAETALFESAKLLSEMGRRTEALEAIDSTLARHPTGRFAEPASFRRCEMLVQANRLVEARGCLEKHRREHPSGLRALETTLLLADLSRLEERWTEAAALYREALARALAPRVAEEAHYGLVVCLQRGKLEGVARAIEEHLARYPDGAHAEELRRFLEAPGGAR